MERVNSSDPDEGSFEEQESFEAPMSLSGEMKHLSQMVWPQVMLQTVDMIKWTASIMFIGRTLGKDELAGFSLASLSGNLTGLSIVIGLLSAADTLCPQAFASKSYIDVGKLVTRGFVLCCIVLVPLIPVWLNVDKILLFFGQPATSSLLAKNFLSTYVFAFPGVVFNESALRFYRVQNILKPLVLMKLISTVGHVCLLKVLVDVCNLGFDGVALAHLGSVYLDSFEVVVLFQFFKLHHPDTFPEKINVSYIISTLTDRAATVEFLKLGIPGIFSMSEWWFWETACFLAGKFGTVSLAAHSCAYTLIPLLYMWSNGVSTAIGIRCGELFAQQNVPAAKLIAKYGIIGNLFIVSGIAAAVYMFRGTIIGLFTKDVVVIALTLKIWPYCAVLIAQDGLMAVQMGLLRAMGMQSSMSVRILISLWLFGLPFTYLLSIVFKLELVGIWVAMPIVYFGLNLSLFYAYYTKDWESYAESINGRFKNGGSEIVPFEEPEEGEIAVAKALELVRKSSDDDTVRLIVEET
mmetsp:Transcript_1499/g.2208  ORF Transcript_1499/g.2208 Transcript_1499/m.2208 type:complete len:521 (-) Transcript_1499:4326-5888(-)|eukprot:CAMPEP_0203751940 /NCGR_PEP_ID=MMETSP0098-20131031/5934_1 /ASSEMBLY_ACC=CAM_ASM_000208 /TAXON_ID=96639 /ORGANISM=" , Strain NY0313808BC1" /LENGTH=520 /DNA_ID=CAMNT_0050641891 /DNA_START=517 /DNA_END=2079 /DNA_ORIENTATION=+